LLCITGLDYLLYSGDLQFPDDDDDDEQQKTCQISTYNKNLLEGFINEYQRDECYENILHKSGEISDEKSTLEHDDNYHKHADPHADPQPKHEELYVKCITHLHNTNIRTNCNK